MDRIVVRGARVHNLKGVDLEIPRDALVVVTGLSGSGKSSLALDTIYAEGQRRYVESLSAYARQFLEQWARPDVDSIEGLSPAIAIGERQAPRSPRSTVGTITEILDYLRLLYARVGRVYCYGCGGEIRAHTVQQIVDRALALPERARFSVIAPVVRGETGAFRERLAELRADGYIRIAVDGGLCDLSQEIPEIDPAAAHTIDVYVDRLVNKEGIRQRLSDSVELAMRLADGLVRLAPVEGEDLLFSERFACLRCGIRYPPIEPRMFSFNSPHGACPACGGLGEACEACEGTRLRRESRHVRVGGVALPGLCDMPLDRARAFLEELELTERERAIAGRLIREASSRLRFLVDVGLAYLTLARAAATLSGGEAQRIRLATQIGASLVGVLYILDEPSIGLHPRDNDRLLAALRRLRDLGNTVLVVEHDAATIRAADYVIDMGPRAGVSGGRVVAAGTPDEIAASADSLTGMYLSGRLSIPAPEERRAPKEAWLTIRGASEHNLAGIDASFPLGLLVCLTGVSGSGKSTLAMETLQRGLEERLGRQPEGPVGRHESLEGGEELERVLTIDQTPIGRTPRSNPATYTGVLAIARELFAGVPESRARGYKANRYSFNVKGGRCEACQGDGIVRIEMSFLPDVFVTCDVCDGRRYNRETLEVRYKGKNIAEVLDMTVSEALEFFHNVPKARQKLETLRDVGLAYLTLGQSATTLSGGEAQRLKLSRELSKKSSGRTLYILDEPTTGLHFDDIRNLLHVLQLLVDQGNSVIVIEHNLDVIKAADWVLDLGPEGGEGGGRILAEGPPEAVARVAESHTGRFLKEVL